MGVIPVVGAAGVLGLGAIGTETEAAAFIVAAVPEV